ncbi:MAG TPA: hypothetical protein VL381_06700 [Rhodocyclaceae bacterium]|nr:hypothetical protein [Rhodocyclaceae bacterium]
MRPSHIATRTMFGFATLLCIGALAIHISIILRGGTPHWAMMANMTGLMIFSVIGTLDQPQGRARNYCYLFGAALIFPSSLWIFLHHGYPS